jgi:hypothetical protein
MKVGYIRVSKHEQNVSFIRIKAPFLKKCAKLPSAFSEWAFSHNVSRRRFLVLSHL